MVGMKHLLSLSVLSFASVSLAAPCKDQSCKIADASGSTGHSRSQYESYKGHLKSESPGGDKCIAKWWDSRFNLNSRRLRARTTAMAPEDFLQTIPEASNITYHERTVNAIVAQEVATLSCKPNILVYARGTVEMGGTGQFVGPNLVRHLKSVMPNQWEVKGVPYHSTFGGDYCAGIPGGKMAAKLLTEVVSQCPNSKIVVSGYSQGAMVVRIGVAFGSPAVRRNTVGVLVFGDPFYGANIAGYNSNNIKTFCHNGDGVCGGALRITPTHLTYGKNAKEGAEWIKQRVTQGKIGEENLGPGKVAFSSNKKR